jgi:hypothetical protein
MIVGHIDEHLAADELMAVQLALDHAARSVPVEHYSRDAQRRDAQAAVFQARPKVVMVTAGSRRVAALSRMAYEAIVAGRRRAADPMDAADALLAAVDGVVGALGRYEAGRSPGSLGGLVKASARLREARAAAG